MYFGCRPAGLDYLPDAPFRFVNEGELDAPPDAVFEVFSDPTGWPAWFRDMKQGAWTSEQKGGVGATRQMKLTTITVDETILAWEPGRRFAFRIDGANRPLLKAMVEDYVLTDLGNGRTHLLWTAAYDPSWLTRALHPLVRMIFGKQFKDTVAGLQAHLRQRPTRANAS